MKETRSQITQPTMAAKAMTADMDALEDITNKRKEKKQMTFEDIKKLVKILRHRHHVRLPIHSRSHNNLRMSNLSIESSDPKGGRRREAVKRIGQQEVQTMTTTTMSV